jgi:hypothetical protein
VEKIDFTLPRGAVITGRVLDEYGENRSLMSRSPRFATNSRRPGPTR